MMSRVCKWQIQKGVTTRKDNPRRDNILDKTKRATKKKVVDDMGEWTLDRTAVVSSSVENTGHFFGDRKFMLSLQLQCHMKEEGEDDESDNNLCDSY